MADQNNFVHNLNRSASVSKRPLLTIDVSKEQEGSVGLVVPKPVRALASPTKSKSWYQAAKVFADSPTNPERPQFSRFPSVPDFNRPEVIMPKPQRTKSSSHFNFNVDIKSVNSANTSASSSYESFTILVEDPNNMESQKESVKISEAKEIEASTSPEMIEAGLELQHIYFPQQRGEEAANVGASVVPPKESKTPQRRSIDGSAFALLNRVETPSLVVTSARNSLQRKSSSRLSIDFPQITSTLPDETIFDIEGIEPARSSFLPFGYDMEEEYMPSISTETLKTFMDDFSVNRCVTPPIWRAENGIPSDSQFQTRNSSRFSGSSSCEHSSHSVMSGAELGLLNFSPPVYSN